MLPPLPNPLSIVEGVTSWFGADLDLPDIPTFVTLQDSPMGTPLAMVVALLVSAVVGLLMHVLVFRPLRHAPPLAKTVASVGVILVIQATIALRFGSDSRSAPPILPNGSIRIFGGVVKADRLWLAAVVIVTAILLKLLFRYTIFGLATRAAAGNEKAALLVGYSPNRLALVCWILSSVLASFIGISSISE